jgi:hypothetical protein
VIFELFTASFMHCLNFVILSCVYLTLIHRLFEYDMSSRKTSSGWNYFIELKLLVPPNAKCQVENCGVMINVSKSMSTKGLWKHLKHSL